MRFRLVALLIASLVCAAGAQTAPDSHSDAHWSYVGKEGPVNWGKLDPDYKVCSIGKLQSPIDIHGAKLNRALKPIEFHYVSGPVTVVNNGHTIQVRPAPGSYIVANGVRYDLVQFHFHHPAEEAVKGKLSDMVVHFVHQSADGKYAAIAVLLNEDINQPNALLSTLFASLPKTEGATEKITESVNPGGLLPPDRSYWTFTGSLTTPPCTEGVEWFVMQQPMTLSRNQLRLFAAIYPMNSRPLQELHGRKIEASQ